ncbi:MAG: DUF6335 family protein [Vicinamibacterales bacterium]|nr:DUF6335 family protein [Vicinamibacterales bacterium]
MAKRNARSRKPKPRRAKAAKKAKKRPAKKTARKTARMTAKKTVARRARRRTSAARKPAASAKRTRPKPAALSRPRRQLLANEEIVVPSAPSTLGYSPKASSAESGHEKYHQRARQHSPDDPRLPRGDLDLDWNDPYSGGEEAPGGDMPSPDQDVVEEIGRALGVEYEDAEELKGSEKIEERDRHRWEYDPASADDYRDRNKKQ